ncbi:DUF6491 family protein [Arenimonas caeni]|nr:DUF6491 family protein [Arenimonas caeni]
MKSRLVVPALVAALSLGLAMPAFAAEPLSKSEQRLILLQANAGEPVEHVRFLRPMDSYEVISPQHVLIWENRFKAWLVELRQDQACKYIDRGFSISVETMRDSLNTKNGFLRGEGGVVCKIIGIREIDVPAWRQAERDAGIRK